MISFDEFQKMDLRIGKIKTAERIEGSDRLIKLRVDVGNESRQIVAGISESYSVVDLINKNIVVLMNLEPKILKGVKSDGMLLAADVDGIPVLLTTEKDVPPGTRIR